MPTNLPVEGYAPGGIIAFSGKDTSLVPDDTADESFKQLPDKERRAAAIAYAMDNAKNPLAILNPGELWDKAKSYFADTDTQNAWKRALASPNSPVAQNLPPVPVKSSPTAPTQTTMNDSKPDAKAETKAEQKSDAKNDSKPDAGPSNNQPSQGGSGSGEKKESAPTLRQQIAAKREEAKRTAEVNAGGRAQKEMDNAPSFAAQVAVQNVIVSAMGFNPSFDVYRTLMLQDAVGYKQFEIYKNQQNVDNVRMMRLLNGASDKLHSDMVDSQYQLER